MSDAIASRFVTPAATRRIRVSFEFFPPKTEEMEKTLWDSIDAARAAAPNFVSVTYGAGGSTRERTHATVKRILAETALDARRAPHLRRRHCEEIDDVIAQLSRRRRAPHRGAARRSDPAASASATRRIPAATQRRRSRRRHQAHRRRRGVGLGLSGEASRQPDRSRPISTCSSAKVDAGATRAITQFFFENDLYFRYLDRVRARGIDVPIVPGILPVQNFKQAKSFAARCGASVPDWLAERFDGLDDDRRPAS